MSMIQQRLRQSQFAPALELHGMSPLSCITFSPMEPVESPLGCTVNFLADYELRRTKMQKLVP